FPSNGRTLTDDAADAFLAVLTNGKVTGDKVGPHIDLLAESPIWGRRTTSLCRAMQLRLSRPSFARRPGAWALHEGGRYEPTRESAVKVPKSAQSLVATLVRTIFAQPDAELTRAQHARVVEQLAPRWPDAARLLADAVEDLLAFTAFPKEHWRQIWSNNPQERLNRELRRRTDVVGIFSNRDAVVRLVGAVLAEQHDEWAVVRRYLTIDGLLKAAPTSLPA